MYLVVVQANWCSTIKMMTNRAVIVSGTMAPNIRCSAENVIGS